MTYKKRTKRCRPGENLQADDIEPVAKRSKKLAIELDEWDDSEWEEGKYIYGRPRTVAYSSSGNVPVDISTVSPSDGPSGSRMMGVTSVAVKDPDGMDVDTDQDSTTQDLVRDRKSRARTGTSTRKTRLKGKSKACEESTSEYDEGEGEIATPSISTRKTRLKGKSKAHNESTSEYDEGGEITTPGISTRKTRSKGKAKARAESTSEYDEREGEIAEPSMSTLETGSKGKSKATEEPALESDKGEGGPRYEELPCHVRIKQERVNPDSEGWFTSSVQEDELEDLENGRWLFSRDELEPNFYQVVDYRLRPDQLSDWYSHPQYRGYRDRDGYLDHKRLKAMGIKP
ncbi:hypothetical protein CPB83DRAFT_897951 [Crepidotus variabilis]|uniref:Uncharacterized protein n=1 Tax=Crepidotus variabilis TaxID=179855 RepID=A0A9P6JKZ9_9AGAR|nr:hypothetical protein CPB83DRAFT_897951 [Crepidotus variabilis]